MSSDARHEYPPANWTADGLAAALDTRASREPLPTYETEAFWEDLTADPVTAETAEKILAAADTAREEPLPALPATHYLRWEREPDITQNELLGSLWTRWRQLSLFALAECIRRDGTFLDPILDAAWAICEQSTWKLTPNTFSDARSVDGLPTPVQPTDRAITLRSAETGKLLADLDRLLGDRLHPALRERIRAEVRRRLIDPFEARTDFHWLQPPTANHNAVNLGCIAVCSLHLLEETGRQARILERVAGGLEQYLNSFDADGCTSEGLGYWNYGMSHYVQAAAAIYDRTGGEYDLCSPPIVERIARFPERIELSPDHYVPFSDSNERQVMDPHVACWLGKRCDLDGVAARGRETVARAAPIPTPHVQRFLSDTLRDIAWARAVPATWEPTIPNRREYFSGFEWWLARAEPGDPDGLVVAAKGGTNDEDHNHNDCGSFVVHCRRESPLTDLGCPIYHRDYFGDGRYDYLATRSIGHSVPYVNGHEQGTGDAFEATVLDRRADPDVDAIELELAGCYPDATGLRSLERSITLDRSTHTVDLLDRAAFVDDVSEASFESVLVSYHPMEPTDAGLAIEGDRSRSRITINEGTAVEVERLEDAVDMRHRAAIGADFPTVWRARIGATADGSPSEATASLAIECSARPDG